MHGGDVIGTLLKNHGVRFVFTLCGGHISPILTGCKKSGIRVVDVRDEATAVYAADAVARLTGIPGVAAVTAGPGVTNTITAIKNAQMAQSPVIILGGATPTILKGRGSLQDIDQITLMRSLVKKALSITKNCDIIPMLEHAFLIALSGVPGPVFVQCPIDVIYDEKDVRALYGVKAGGPGRSGLRTKLLQLYLKRHVDNIFACEFDGIEPEEFTVTPPSASAAKLNRAAEKILSARKPLLLIGSQAMLNPREAPRLAGAVEALGIPAYLAGMARGLLGRSHPLQMRHSRKSALMEADCVVLAGMPCDFRLDYGRSINPRASIVAINRSGRDLRLNITPDIALHGDPFISLCALASDLKGRTPSWDQWKEQLAGHDAARNAEIDSLAGEKTPYINPLRLLKILEGFLHDDAVVVVDGGDFAASASYIINPRGPLAWLDPGVFGTLGVGAGFALGAKLAGPGSEVWILYGDGAAGYSLQEFDTFARHGIPVIGLIGNDAGWTQIARDQVAIFHDDVATTLEYTDYHKVAEGYGGRGILVTREKEVLPAFRKARNLARKGIPVLINARIGETGFRKGSISM